MTGSPEDIRGWRLPRGRHGLPREIVVRSQRERLLAAVVRVTAKRGYDSTTVADILDDAGVGRESFYELFADKRECMLAAQTILVDDLESKARAAYTEPGSWVERVGNALAAVLVWFSADPAIARFILIEMAGIGPASRVRFEADFTRFVKLMDDGLDDGALDPDLARASSLAVSATVARVYEEIVLDRTVELPSLLPELTYELLVPFLGEEAALVERRRAAATRSPAPGEAP